LLAAPAHVDRQACDFLEDLSIDLALVRGLGEPAAQFLDALRVVVVLGERRSKSARSTSSPSAPPASSRTSRRAVV
jgi:hypothetical protein